jgi:hypothetical protein
MVVGGKRHASAALPAGKTRNSLWVAPQDRSGRVRKISPPSGFDSRTVHPVGSRYTDYATRPTFIDFFYWIILVKYVDRL